MYSISNHFINKGKLLDKMELLDIDGFLMGSKNKTFKIEGANVQEICIMNRKLANPLVSKKVFQKYNNLILRLTELLVDDDDDGETYQEVLNQIEKFRMEIKNKYRDYLMKKELEKMSKQLSVLQKEAKDRLVEMYCFDEYQNDNSKRH